MSKIIKFFQGNPRLKAPGVSISFTQQQAEERLKCIMDPVYFMENYVKIVHVDRGLIPFEMFPFQKELVRSFNDNRYTIGKLPRQCGKSTASVGFILWTILFGPLQNIAILANKGKTAQELLEKLQKCYENVPLWMQQGVVSWNKTTIEVENGSKVMAGSTSSSAIRGYSFNIIFLDEFAFVPPHVADEFFTSVFPTISSGDSTKLIMVSTPKGLNHFHKFWVNANKPKTDPDYNGYVPIEAHWSVVPGRDNKWYKEQLRVLGPERFDQEFGCEFLGSSSTLISGTKLNMLSWVNPISKSGNVDLYALPEKDHLYVIAVDTARGLNADYSAFTVIDCTTTPYRIVAKYRSNKIDSYLYPEVIHNVALYYNKAHCLVETNDVGKQVADILHNEFEYEHIFSTQNIGRSGQRLSSGFGGRSGKLGVATSNSMKRIGCSNLKALIETDGLLAPDKDIVEEFYTFVRKKDSFAADDGKHDDLVMTLVMFAWLSAQPAFKELTSTDIRAKLSSEMQQTSVDQVMPFGYISDGTEKTVEIDDQGNAWEDVPNWQKKTQRFFKDQHYSMEDYEDDDYDGFSL